MREEIAVVDSPQPKTLEQYAESHNVSNVYSEDRESAKELRWVKCPSDVDRPEEWVRLYRAGVSIKTIAALTCREYCHVLDVIRRQVGGGDYVNSTCVTCGKTFWRKNSRSHLRRRPFCSRQCYYASRNGVNFKESRHGGRIARRIAAQYFPLKPGHVVHHRDSNQANNAVENLCIFASQGDHMAFHHGTPGVLPLWDGKRTKAA